MVPSQKSKLINLEMWLGFSDELQKISSIPRPTSFGDVRKVVSNEGTALAKRKPVYAKVNKAITPSASPNDLAQSSKVIQPPPVTGIL